MKKQALMVLTTLSLFVTLAAVSAHAQSNMRLNVNIPFDFSVGNKVLPSGEYTVRYVTQEILVIRSADCSATQVFLTYFTQASKTRNESSLVFNRYGDQYFLATIWTAGNDSGHEISESRSERELVRTSRALAKSAPGRETVSIIAQR
jgi:hypothetical protein